MNAVSGIFVALAVFFGGCYALDRIYAEVKSASVERVHKGMPSLSEFTNRLTYSKIVSNGTLVPLHCVQARKHAPSQQR